MAVFVKERKIRRSPPINPSATAFFNKCGQDLQYHLLMESRKLIRGNRKKLTYQKHLKKLAQNFVIHCSIERSVFYVYNNNPKISSHTRVITRNSALKNRELFSFVLNSL